MCKTRLCVFLLGVFLLTVPASADLIGWWKLDDGTGTTAVDSSPKGQNGVLTGGPVWNSAGVYGSCLQFDGVNDYVVVTGTFDMPQYTVSLWFRQDGGVGTQVDLVSVEGAGQTSGVLLEVGTNGQLRFLHRAPLGTTGGPSLYTTTAPSSGAWHHMAAVKSSTQMLIYVDGQLAVSQAEASTFNISPTLVYIGVLDTRLMRMWPGLIDDVKIFDTALSDVEVLQAKANPAAGTASNPNPKSQTTDIPRDTTLAWKPSATAATHDVYLGTTFEDVNKASRTAPNSLLVSQGQDANTFDPPGLLQFGQTYYWRIDEVNAPPSSTIFTGAVWNFTVEPVFYTVTGIIATASSFSAGAGPENTINGSGLNASDQHDAENATMWATAKGTTLPAWIQYDLGRVRKVESMIVWNYNGQFEDIIGLGAKGVKVEYSTDGTNWTQLSGVPEFAQGPGAEGYASNTTVNFGGVPARYVKMTITSTWGATQTGLSEVRFLQTIDYAREPQPASGATNVNPDLALGWRPGRQAASHSVYAGTDPNALTLAGTAATNSFFLANLSLATTYYWRVDEVNTVQAITTWASDVWNFTTSPFIAVDDIESYNDTTNKVFDVWVDGYGTTTNGSVVGLAASANGTFGSTTIFHAGKQSMPFAYNNTGSFTNSEATRTFDAPQDWTRNGVKTLTLYFYGQAGNATTVPFWVKLTDQNNKTTKVTFGSAAGEDPIVLADPAWTAWNIPLSSFSGITLSKIKSMTIGLGTGTGTGMLYIDDIRLYPAVTATTVAPTLVGWWKLDNNVQDSSGNGNNGTITGAPTWATGKIGSALVLNGTADYVDCGNGASFNITDTVTLSAWIKPNAMGNSAYQNFVSKGDQAYCLQQTSGNLIQLAIYDGTWYSANSAVVTSAMNGTWHHVAGTYDGTQVRLYVDGKMASSILRTGVIATTTYTVSIGRNSQQSGRLFNGTIDDVRIYHGVLPTSEIIKLANP